MRTTASTANNQSPRFITCGLSVRSYERSDRIYNAMLARGYTGQLRTLNPHVMKRGDWLFAALSAILILILQLIGRL